MNEFGTYHPAVVFLYFAFVIAFSMVFRNPVCLVISLLAAFTYSALIGGRRTAVKNVASVITAIVATGLLNPAFSHEGVTVLTYLPSGNPLTLESILYGVGAGALLITVIMWFSCFGKIFTSDKLIYLFGRIIPALSLIFSMTLRFVPLFAVQLKKVAAVQKTLGADVSRGSVISRAKNGLVILSCLVTWSLENAVDTADSMKSRGYGLPGRTAFSIFRFDRRDAILALYVIVCGIYVLAGHLGGAVFFRYYPSIKWAHDGADIYAVSVYIAYAALCFMPIIIELWEERKWKALKSKI